MHVLNYGNLLRAYNEALHVTLRNFSPVPEYLDTWVPDENPTRSILGIFEAAAESSEPGLKLEISEDISKQLDRDWLKSQLASLGEVHSDASSIEIRYFHAKELEIHPIYRDALNRLAQRITHEGLLEAASPQQQRVVAESNGVRLVCLINPQHEVIAARHEGARGAERVILDQLCAESLGKPIQEVAEHGTIRVEYRLRDKNAVRPIQGITLPVNADPAFRLPQQLARKAYEEYQNLAKIEGRRNFYVDPVAPSFAQLSREDKIRRISQALLQACQELGLQDRDIEVVDLKPEVRAVIHFRQDSSKPSFGRAMLRLERLLQERVESRIELVLESLEDSNRRKGRGEKILALESAKRANQETGGQA